MSETLVVTVAGPDRVDEVMALALAASAENGFLQPDPSLLLNDVWSALTRDHGVCGVIGEPEGKAEGMIVLRLGHMSYSQLPVLEEKLVFVAPEFRAAKGGRARRLAEFGKMMSDELHIPLLIGVLSNHRTEGKVKLYERMFGKPAGAFFLYGAQTGTFAVAAE